MSVVCVVVVPKQTVVVRGALHAGTNGASTPLFNTRMTHPTHTLSAYP